MILGGTLVPIGGHNIIEPAQMSKCIIVGNYFSKIRDTVNIFKNEKAVKVLENNNNLSKIIIDLYNDKNTLKDIGKKAFSVTQSFPKKENEIVKKIISLERKMKTPKFWYKDNSILKYILYPLTSLWLLGSYLKKAYVKPKKFSIPIICVGNIIAGGSGKTPLTIQLAKLFLKKKYVVHIIKKQYKSKNEQIVTLVHEKSDPALVGDEPILTSKITSTWLVKDRKVGIKLAIKKGANLIILDDGYQDYSIIKDFNILTINERQQFGNKNIIPAGPLREKIYNGIKKADSIFFYGKKKFSRSSYIK